MNEIDFKKEQEMFDERFELAQEQNDHWNQWESNVKSFLLSSNHRIAKQVEAKTRLDIFELLHKEVMATNNVEMIDLLEKIQIKVLNHLQD